MSIDIQNTKIELIQWLTTIENAKVLQKLNEIKNAELANYWDLLSEEETKSIEKGLKDSKNSNTVRHSEAKKLYEKYL